MTELTAAQRQALQLLKDAGKWVQLADLPPILLSVTFRLHELCLVHVAGTHVCISDRGRAALT